ncbi:hypothetical protein QBC44DRAFT_310586 [Cladorrhinum sp. PSN332]|nr:hypothetical protein QBC44DRAFT_310586 [Cladorrhinum sp. PSN332]
MLLVDHLRAQVADENETVQRDVSNTHVGTEWQMDLPSWVPDWTQPASSDIDPARRIILLEDPVLAVPIMARLISAVTQRVSVLMGDTSLYLLAWSLDVVANFGFLVALAVWVWRYTWFLIIPGLIIFLCSRLFRGRTLLQLLTSIFTGSGSFREARSLAGYDGHELHFFVTDTGITGSTAGPITTEDGDCLAQPEDAHLVTVT